MFQKAQSVRSVATTTLQRKYQIELARKALTPVKNAIETNQPQARQCSLIISKIHEVDYFDVKYGILCCISVSEPNSVFLRPGPVLKLQNTKIRISAS